MKQQILVEKDGGLKSFLLAEKIGHDLSRYIAHLFDERDVSYLSMADISEESGVDECIILDALRMRGIDITIDYDLDGYRRDQFDRSLDNEVDEKRRRTRIPREVRRIVFERDGGCCQECGSDFDIQYDHIIPFSRGGSNTVENIEILCAPCNIAKSDTI